MRRQRLTPRALPIQAGLLAPFFLVPLLLAVTACSSPEPPTAPADTYEVRGLIRHLPTADHNHGEILLHHEAIPDFKDDEGRVVGMDAMAMTFPVDDESMLAGLAVGDKVTFEFEVAWHGREALRLTRIDKLPAETELDFGRAARAAAADN